MAPSRPALGKSSSFTQTTLDGSLSKLAVSTASDRVFTDALLSIKPVHLANIVSRQENHEYRKYRLRDGVTRLWLYETSDGGGRSSITHIAVIPASVRHTPGSQSKYGYPVLELYELVRPVTLGEMKSRAIGADLWKDRWREGQEIAEKLRRVF
ncbi:hypothetical protein IWW34DRAFT_755641 [Fusarium oxysporum f. sp. albedinis]|nr:hypothetical protein IWW34DRAFT_755641 [Fusarium oxysporum f. sp. albedinis]